jgi:hypothetical protein
MFNGIGTQGSTNDGGGGDDGESNVERKGGARKKLGFEGLFDQVSILINYFFFVHDTDQVS